MNIAFTITMGAAGMTAGWLIPLMASKTVKYKLRKTGGTLPVDARFTSPILKLVCLLINGALWAAVGIFTENLLHAALLAVILLDAVVITIIDIQIRLIPNEAVLIMLLTGLILQLAFYGLMAAMTALLTMAGVMLIFVVLGTIMGLNTIGAGDVKLAGAMGLALGWPNIIYGMVGMGAILFVWCAGGLATKKLKLNSMLALAPFLMAGLVFAIVANISGY